MAAVKQCVYCGRKGTRGFTETRPVMCSALIACVKRARTSDASALVAARNRMRAALSRKGVPPK